MVVVLVLAVAAVAGMWFKQVGKTSALGHVCKIFAVLAFSKVCVAHNGNVHAESSEPHDKVPVRRTDAYSNKTGTNHSDPARDHW